MFHGVKGNTKVQEYEKCYFLITHAYIIKISFWTLIEQSPSGDTRELKVEKFSGRRQLQPDVKSLFL